MSRADLTQGIDNRGEFYSHHYLDALLASDLKPLLKRWRDDEQANPALKQPPKRLNSLAAAYFMARSRAADPLATPADRLDAARGLHARLLDALGYRRHPTDVSLDDGTVLPLAHEERRGGRPALWVIEAPFPSDDDADDPMEQAPVREQLHEADEASQLPDATWRELLDRSVFRQEESPTWVLFLGGAEVVLTHAHKWGLGKALAFDLDDLFARRQAAAFQAMAGLLHHDALVPGEGTSLHETLEDSSHKHAFAVSTDLREGAQRAIELLGNEAVHYVRQRRPTHPDGGRWSFQRIDADELTRECLVYLYRLIFLFYVESRSDELGVAPMKAEAYRSGYSLESLRALETVPLTSPEAQEGFYLHHTLAKLFRLVNRGYPDASAAQQVLGYDHDGASFRIPGLRSRLFDPATTPLLSACELRNVVLQQVIELLSLSKEGGKHGRGRISYASLGINQLGAVYEGLLSYTGFFAPEPLIEVANRKDNGKEGARTWFVPAADRDRYDDDELVRHDDGRRVEVPAHTFLFRLAGRDREKSASYYTPEVLTRCLVKYTLAERIGTDPSAPGYLPADALLQLTVCEPAMGSGAFLGEVVNQLATAYLQRKQAEQPVNDDPSAGPLNPIPAERYGRELQRVKARIAANQCYGVDLNPLAAELGKVSLWLGVLRPGAPAPFFDARIATGNSLVGARRQVHSTTRLHKRSKKLGDNWLSVAPTDLSGPRTDTEVYHFLLPAEGMAPFDKDKVVKGLCPEQTDAIKAWRKALNAAWSASDKQRLLHLSQAIDGLWARHAEARQLALSQVDQAHAVWPAPMGVAEVDHDEEHFAAAWARYEAGNRAGRTLKQVMDYWCALWFWPVRSAAMLPTRDQWLGDLAHLLLEAEPLPGTDERLTVAGRVAARRRFVHWEWLFPEVFEGGGFDVVVGNPPWIKVQWNESGILSDLDPVLEIRRQSAKQVADLRQATLKNEAALDAYLGEFEELMGLKGALNDVQNYPLLQGVQTNLYKAFLSLGWSMLDLEGAGGMFHQAGIFDDPKGGTLRQHAYRRMRWAALAKNQLKLFDGVHHERPYCFTVWGGPLPSPRFRTIANLFHPRTLDASLAHDGRGEVPAIKTPDGDWDLRGHRSRVVEVDEATLALFAKLYDPPGTPALEARLPVVHSAEILAVLRKISASRSVGASGRIWYSVYDHLDQSRQVADGTIRPETTEPCAPASLILSGPHFYCSNPLNKTPNEGCKHNQDYTVIDLQQLSTNYLPRTNFVPACSPDEWRRRAPSWQGEPFLDRYRHVHREMVAPTGERTFVGAIVPPGVAHVHTVLSLAFASTNATVAASAMWSSLPVDFFMKSTGAGHANQALVSQLPFPSHDVFDRLCRRGLRLNCLTEHYADLWSELYDPSFRDDTFTKPDPRLPDWSHLGPEWTWDTPLRTPYARRQALVELDALAALALGLTADELCLIYRVQFPVLQQYEADTWYDQRGRIVFTNNRGLNGVGLSRKQWDELKGAQVGPHRFEGLSDPPEWAVDALGPYEAPFDRCDREEDMRQAYTAFVARGVVKGDGQ
jgi:hypothetical protein